MTEKLGESDSMLWQEVFSLKEKVNELKKKENKLEKKCPEKVHVYETITISSIEHIDNGWIVTGNMKEVEIKLYFDYDRLNEALTAIGNGKFEQCTMCGNILKY